MTSKKVAIVGAGCSGLCAARMFAKDGNFLPVVFEQRSHIGGVWRQDPVNATIPVSPIYDNLRCNLPKQTMYYPDFKYPEDEPSFMHHTAVLKYIEEYSKHFDLEQYINFNNEVVHVEPMLDDEVVDRFVRWKVKTKDLLTLSIQEDIYDAIVICNGHYSIPLYADIENIENFQGKNIHSLQYRDPKSFSKNTVVVLGAGASAVDIAIDISSKAQTVYIAHRGENFTAKGFPENVFEKTNIKRVTTVGTFVFDDDSEIAADAFVQCTGYEYSLPFLSPKCGISVKEGGRIVTPLYKHIVNPKYPSMGFIGLVWKSLAAPIFHVQCAYFCSFISQKESPMPETYMINEETAQRQQLRDKNLPLHYLHRLNEELQFQYSNNLSQLSGVNISKEVEDLFFECMQSRNDDISGYKFTA